VRYGHTIRSGGVASGGTVYAGYGYARDPSAGGGGGPTGTGKPKRGYSIRGRIGFGRHAVYGVPKGPGTVRNAALSVTDASDVGSATSVLLGVLGSSVPAVGSDGPALLYQEVIAYSLQSSYVRAEILSVTAGYTPTFYGDSSFSVVSPTLTGVCTITYRWYVDGVLQSGTGTVLVDFPSFAALGLVDAPDTLAGQTTGFYPDRSVSLSTTDAADTLVALLTSPVGGRNVALSVLDDIGDTVAGAALVQLVGRTAGLALPDDADTLDSLMLQVDERFASLSVTDAADTLISTGYWLDPVVAALVMGDEVDVMSSGMNTAPGTRERVELDSPIIMQITLESSIDLG
jgi:hypothetical protein